jgi:hypothetical protein
MNLAEFLAVVDLQGLRREGRGYVACCPAHEDRSPSLSLAERDGRLLVHCHAGCTPEAIVAALGLRLSDLFSDEVGQRAVGAVRVLDHQGGLEALAQAKRLPVELLSGLGCVTRRQHGLACVRIPYTDCNGEVVAWRSRHALVGRRFSWRKGDHPSLYGLDLLAEIRALGWVLLVEGESDVWSARHWRIPCLGIPGKATWRSQWAELLGGLNVYLWQEPDAQDLAARVAVDMPQLRVIVAPPAVKDISEAHCQGRDVAALVEELKGSARSAGELGRQADEARLAALARAAEPVLGCADPLELVALSMRAAGYGGDLRPALLTYLAATSRLLAMRDGAMPVHLLLVGPAGSGKSYTLKVVLDHLPPEAVSVIDAGSPRVLIYDTSELAHRLVVFGEADSLPAGEDNPAASAVRGLLQDHHLHYAVTEKEPKTGSYRVRQIAKPGPTTLITTATRRLGPQLDSRLFVLEVPDDRAQTAAALRTQADLELRGMPRIADPALVAYQAYLQERAPWQVIVPFADRLAEALARQPTEPRVGRDFARLLSLVKAATVLRHRWRSTDRSGHLLAEMADYALAYELAADVYRPSAGGTGEKVRAAVDAVQSLLAAGKPGASVSQVAGALGLSAMAASRRVRSALRGGWLINAESRKGHPYRLSIGEPLPAEGGLPAPETLWSNTLTPHTAGAARTAPSCSVGRDRSTEVRRGVPQPLCAVGKES